MKMKSVSNKYVIRMTNKAVFCLDSEGEGRADWFWLLLGGVMLQAACRTTIMSRGPAGTLWPRMWIRGYDVGVALAPFGDTECNRGRVYRSP